MNSSNVYEITGTTSDAPELWDLWDLGCEGIWEEERDGETIVLAFFPEPIDLPIPGRWTTVEQRDWVGEFQETLQPFQIDQLIIAPTHSEVTLKAFEHVLWIDPGMAFGSGHHETTSMAIRALSGANLAGKTVLDVGAGSGILAIAADRFGARVSYGVDTDPGTVRVANENAARNFSRAKFAAGTIDAPGHLADYDVIVANLYAELHVELFHDYAKRLSPGGKLFLTGILTSKGGLVKNSIPPSLRLMHTRTDQEWVLFELEAT